jgi:hypothetical protein
MSNPPYPLLRTKLETEAVAGKQNERLFLIEPVFIFFQEVDEDNAELAAAAAAAAGAGAGNLPKVQVVGGGSDEQNICPPDQVAKLFTSVIYKL